MTLDQAFEEDVFDLLVQYVKRLNCKEVALLIRFSTAMEVLRPNTVIHDAFNGCLGDGWTMAPTSNMCSDTIHVSRYLDSYDKLKNTFTLLFNNEAEWNRVDVA